ncbi:6327_t:CDS:2, partial [Entrophospora sp. SA101]
ISSNVPRPTIHSVSTVLAGLEKRYHDSFPYSKWGHLKDDYSFNRVKPAILDLKAAIIDYADHFTSSEEFPTITFSFLHLVTEIAHRLPEWDNRSHNEIKHDLYLKLVEYWQKATREAANKISDGKIYGQTVVNEWARNLEQQKNNGFSVTAMEYRTDGLSLAVGISTGHVLLYDLRASRPWLVKDHQYGYPIKNLKWYDDVIGDKGRNKVISADCKIMKIWDAEDVIGTNFTSVEPNTDINDICIIPETGLIFVANEGIQIGAYYIPALGPAPKWCSFLDNLTEELEENPQQNIYDDYKFVTRKELEKLGMEHLIGTNILRPYMHGFFVDLRLYEKAKSIANPFAYSEYREQIIKQKLEKERESRIRVTKKLPKGENLLEDGRFKELFINPDFEIKTDQVF